MKTITKLIVSAVLMCVILPASAQKSQVLEIKFQGLDATLYSKSIDEQYLSELVLYCPSLMNGIILFQGKMSADEIGQELMGEGKITFN